jgi:uncharacterized DUF497 family protein
MDITYDDNKNDRNIAERDLDFNRAVDFDFESAITKVDDRNEYGETRILSLGYLDNRLHVLCYVNTDTGFRIISFRKANQREVKYYEKVKATN